MTLFFRLAAFAAIAAVVVLTLGPLDLRAMSPVDSRLDRAFAYLVISFFLILSFPRRPLLMLGVILLIIVGLEAAQQLRPDRHGRLIDMVEKAAGAGAGALLAAGTLWAMRRRRS